MAKPHRRSSRKHNDPISQVERRGLRPALVTDFYHNALTMPISGLLALIGTTYIVANLIFAVLYLAVGGIANAGAGSFADAFFFSVQTMATIGYGYMYPQSSGANLLATLESVYGLLTVALSSGIMFARISRPTARVMFSRIAVVALVNGVPTLIFRVANQRRNRIVEAQMSVSLLRDEVTKEGVDVRRFHDLALVRSRSPMFALTWSVFHPIDQASPLHGLDGDSFASLDSEIVCSMTGLDDISIQTVHARYIYGPHDVKWGKRLADIIETLPDGRRAIDYAKFHDIVEAPLSDDGLSTEVLAGKT
jgi:inward rectifier potassium channel